MPMRSRHAILAGPLWLLLADPVAARPDAPDLWSLCLATLPGTAPDGLWAAWSLSPWIVGPLAAACALYGRGYRASRGQDRARAGLFVAGIACLAVALVSPLCRLSSTLAWAHMIQHVLLVAGAPVCLALSRPGAVLQAGLPAPLRRMAEVGRLLPSPQPHAFLAVSFLLYGVNIWAWHIPALYQGALLDAGLHLIMVVSLLLVSLLYWHATLEAGRRADAAAGLAAILLFFTFLHTGALGIFLTLAGRVWYPLLASRSGAWNLSPLDDQKLAGLIMWVPMGFLYLGAALALMALLITSSGSVRPSSERA
jgi:putative membrane protein